MDRPEEALEQGEKALKMDPYNALFRGIYGLTLLMTRRYDKALEQSRIAVKISPTDIPSLGTIHQVMHLKGMYKEALTAAKKIYTGLELTHIAEAMEQEYKKNGYSAAMKLVADTLEELSKKTHISIIFICYVHTYAGNKNKVLEWFEKGYQIKDPNMPYIIEPCFVDFLRDEPRYQELLRKMNLPIKK
jgi:tetratricopeptide (TPR) repeat protein